MSTKLIQMTMGAHYKKKGSRCRELSRYVFLLMIRILQSEIRIIENKKEKNAFTNLLFIKINCLYSLMIMALILINSSDVKEPNNVKFD